MDLSSTLQSTQQDPHKSGVYHHLSLTCIPQEIFTLKSLKSLDLSNNKLTRLPGKIIAQELTLLESLDLQCNMLYMLEDLIDLSTMPRLYELNFIQNPVRLLNNRIYLLEAFFKAPGCEENVLVVVERDAAAALNNKVLEQKDTSYLLKSLPRKKGFPMLQRLNDQWITEQETKAVEKEMGHKVEYFRSYRKNGTNKYGKASKNRQDNEKKACHYDGSRMSITEIRHKESMSRAVTAAPVIQRFQFDAATEGKVPISVREEEENFEQTQNKWLESNMEGYGLECIDIDHNKQLANDDKNDKEEEEKEEEEETILHTVLTNTTALLSCQNNSEHHHQGKVNIQQQQQQQEEEDEESWNYPISSFDKLGSEDRSYVRLKSKQVTGNAIKSSTTVSIPSMNPIQFLNKDFESSIFLDCVAQTERSRRLTVKAVDLLTESSTLSLPVPLSQSSSCANLRRNLNKKFNKTIQQETFQRVEAFSQRQVQVGEMVIQSDISDLFQAEHLVQKQKNHRAHTRVFLSDPLHRHSTNSRSDDERKQSNKDMTPLEQMEETIEDSLSRLKLRNAMDLANSLGNNHVKQAKKMLKLLIEADQKVIEEERIQQEYQNHRIRLAHIMQRRLPNTNTCTTSSTKKKKKEEEEEDICCTKFISPWQERNHRAKLALLQEAKRPRKKSQGRLQQESNHSQTIELYKTIETVEMAAKDSLETINSHDLLVRCGEIRRHAEKSIHALASYQEKFMEEEAAWEKMRQDPINLLKRRIRRRQLKEDSCSLLDQEIQIGSAQVAYSSLFLQ